MYEGREGKLHVHHVVLRVFLPFLDKVIEHISFLVLYSVEQASRVAEEHAAVLVVHDVRKGVKVAAELVVVPYLEVKKVKHSEQYQSAYSVECRILKRHHFLFWSIY